MKKDILIKKIVIRRINVMSMKFVKGMLIGGLISTGIAMMYTERMQPNRKKVMKMGRQFAKKMGIM